MKASKGLTIAMAGAAVLALGTALTWDEPPVTEAIPTAPGIDQAQRSTLPRAEGGRILLDVSRETFSAPWPLAGDEATVTCRPPKVATIITSSAEYGLSGPAIAAGYPSIWDSLLPIELRRDAALGPLVKAALALCPETGGGGWSRDTGKDEPARH